MLALAVTACAHGGARAAQIAEGDEAQAARRALLEAAAMEGVVSGLSDFEARASKYSRDEWNFVLGYAHFSDGRFEQAEKHLSDVGDGLPALADYLLFYRAAAANRMGQHAHAAEFLDRLAGELPGSVWTQEAAVERAISQAGLKRYQAAIKLLDGALDSASDRERARIEKLIARAYIDMGAGERAASYVKGMAIASGCEEDLEDLGDLISEIKRRFGVDIDGWLSSPSNQLRLVQSFGSQSQWSDAAIRLERLLARKDLGPAQRAQVKWLLAKAYRWTHRYDEAIALLTELRRSPSGRSFGGLNYTLALIYAKKNDYDNAIALRRRMLDRLPPASGAAANLAYKIAYLYMDEGKYDEAIEHWKRVTSMRGSRQKATLARWYIGWSYLMKGDYGAALSSFDELIKSGAKRASIDDRVRYWRGRTLFAMGRSAEASKAFGEVVGKYPRGYYAELARRRLAGDDRETCDFVMARDLWSKAKGWHPASVEGGGSPHMARAIELDKLGLHEEAAREVKAVDLKRHPELAEPTMWLAFRNYAHDYAYRLAQKRYRPVLKRLPGHDRFSRFVWEQAYPYAYEPVVSRLAAIEGVDPLLVWSVMRNESAFKPVVISSAGAVGLMQLMPTTASVLAREAGSGGHSRGDLYNPAINIAYGVTYLGKLADIFDGNAVAMIASYNAGEEAVGRWLANGSSDDIEGWIEEIPYSETNLYVKKVLTSYWKYQRLYGRRATPQVGSRNRVQDEEGSVSRR